jgi:hypothetical protein
MEEFNPPELQKRNNCTLEAMYLKFLETSPVMLFLLDRVYSGEIKEIIVLYKEIL